MPFRQLLEKKEDPRSGGTYSPDRSVDSSCDLVIVGAIKMREDQHFNLAERPAYSRRLLFQALLEKHRLPFHGERWPQLGRRGRIEIFFPLCNFADGFHQLLRRGCRWTIAVGPSLFEAFR